MKNTIFYAADYTEFKQMIQSSVKDAIAEVMIERGDNLVKNDLTDVSGASDFLKLKIPTIYSKVSRGELPYMKRYGRLYFSLIELTEYIKQGKQQSNSEIEANAETFLIERRNRHV